MQKIILMLICISALAFVLAIISVLIGGGHFLTISAEAYSRTCTNIALIAIALVLWVKEKNV